MIKLNNGVSLLDLYAKYQDLRTVASPDYGRHIFIQVIGHAMNYTTIHLIQPNAVYHNTYLALIGESTTTKKTTAQEIAKAVDNQDTFLADESSPEALLKDLSAIPHGKAYLGEWSKLLRSMNKGNMAKFREVANDLHSCPKKFRKKLVAEEYIIKQPYLSINTTCTPEQLKANIAEEDVLGGFLPRWILVLGNPKYRPRGPLETEVSDLEEQFKKFVSETYKFFRKNHIRFTLNENALERFNEIDKGFSMDTKWEGVRPFAGRYANYIITYADILWFLDFAGAMGFDAYTSSAPYTCYTTLTKLTDNTKITNLTDLTYLSKNEYISKEEEELLSRVSNLDKLSKLVKSVKSVKTASKKTLEGPELVNDWEIEVNRDYIDSGYKIILPSLNYAKSIADYIFEDRKILKLSEKTKQFSPMSRSRALQLSKLRKKQFDAALDTLLGREEVFIFQIEKEARGMKITHMICRSEYYNIKRCEGCKYKTPCFAWVEQFGMYG